MAGAIEQILRDIAAMEQQVVAIAQDLQQTYAQYLTVLGQAIRKQFILAAYQVCTQHYPERFLSLSVAEREQLQQSLRQVARTAEADLLAILQQQEPEPPTQELPSLTPGLMQNPANLFATAAPNSTGLTLNFTGNFPNDFANTLQAGEMSAANPDVTDLAGAEAAIHQAIDTAIAAAMEEAFGLVEDELGEDDDDGEVREDGEELTGAADAAGDGREDEEPTTVPLLDPSTMQRRSRASGTLPLLSIKQGRSTPVKLVVGSIPAETSQPKEVINWQEMVEGAIAELLNKLSLEGNRLLWRADVIARRFPESLLEIAAKADTPSEMAAGAPNLLQMVIEADNLNPGKEGGVKFPGMPQSLCMVHLRLTEVEFVDSTTLAWRGKIREVMARLTRLEREYRKLQRKRAIAEAEVAWRSTWTE